MQGVLITGMSGLIGSAVRRQLEGTYQLFALNRRDVPGVPTHRADIANLAAILPAFAGKDAVVHLAAALGADDWAGILSTNVVGTYHVFEAARRAGVQRVIFASSGLVVANYELDEPFKALVQGRYQDVPAPRPLITHEWPVRPNGLYACGKAWGEALGRYYADTFGISVICIRIGRVRPEDRPVNVPREYAIWCSQRDAAQMVERCLAAPPDLRFAIFFLTSDNTWGFRDLERPRKLVGFVPQDSADRFLPPG